MMFFTLLCAILITVQHSGLCWEIAPGGFTNHFRTWLSNHPEFNKYDFPQDEILGGSYGGKIRTSDKIVNDPVVFVPGGSSVAQNYSTHFAYFLTKGYKISELYAMTYNAGHLDFWDDMTHRKAYVMQIRKFIEAVLEYTCALKIDVITHSMGVTLARKAIKGGPAIDREETYEVGPPLTDRVDTFIGIGGANYGLIECGTEYYQPLRCNSVNGYHPGYFDEALNKVVNRAWFLQEMIDNPAREGSYVYSIYSRLDEYFGDDNYVLGEVTTRIPNQTGEKAYDDSDFTHCSTKDKSVDVQLHMIKNHIIS